MGQREAARLRLMDDVRQEMQILAFDLQDLTGEDLATKKHISKTVARACYRFWKAHGWRKLGKPACVWRAPRHFDKPKRLRLG